jgi:hypothetical protein
MSIPVITVLSQDKTKISDETDYDLCTVTFNSDVNLDWWQARATKTGVTPGLGVGLLVESGDILKADTSASIYVEDNELTNGDGDYIITVYGHSIDGYYSDGSEESTVVVNIDNLYTSYKCTISGDTVDFTTTENTDISKLAFGYYWYNDWTLVERVWGTSSIGWYALRFTKTADFNRVIVGFMADKEDAGVIIDLSSLTDEIDYFITFNVNTLELNHAVMTDFAILRIL